MPEAAVAPSAPSSSAPAPAAAATPAAAPAAPAAPAGPAWADGDVGSFLASVTSSGPSQAKAAPAAIAAPAAPAPVAAPTTPAAEPTAPAVPAQPVAPENPVAAAPAAEPVATPKLYAGRYKTVEELEAGYNASGQEARRLVDVTKQQEGRLKQMESDLQARATELEKMKLEQQLGPDLVEPTPEEIAQWDANKIATFRVNQLKRANLKEKLERDAKLSEVNSKREFTERAGRIQQRFDAMAKDEKRFPRFAALEKSMIDVLGLASPLVGHDNAPLICYLAAYGHEALQKDLAVQGKEAEAAETARRTAAAGLPAVSGPGAAAPPPSPSALPRSGPLPGSDEEHNARLIEAHTGYRPILPID